MFNSYPPLYPYSDFNYKEIENSKNIMFLSSARDALFLIIETLKESFENLIFLIPSYTCHSVIETLQRTKVDYDFVDLDDSLDFDLNDLNDLLDNYSNKRVVLIPTSLFGALIRDYKELYKDIIVIEDLAQSNFNYQSKAEFQFVSFGRGKLISAWSGGGIISKDKLLYKKYNNLELESNFFKNYTLANIQKLISKYFWFFIENSPLNPENIKDVNLELKDKKLFKLEDKTISWILNSISNINLEYRRELSNLYLNNISNKYLFDLKSDTPFLRFPIKKVVKKSGVSFMRDYRYTYNTAKEKRKKELKIAQELSYNSSFLPTHNLIPVKYAKKLLEEINE